MNELSSSLSLHIVIHKIWIMLVAHGASGMKGRKNLVKNGDIENCFLFNMLGTFEQEKSFCFPLFIESKAQNFCYSRMKKFIVSETRQTTLRFIN